MITNCFAVVLVVWASHVEPSWACMLPVCQHMYMDPTMARSFVTRWKPQFVGCTPCSITGIPAYVRARIQLRSSLCVGAFVSHRDVLFVVNNAVGTPKNPTYHVTTVLWNAKGPNAEDFRIFKNWWHASINCRSIEKRNVEIYLEGNHLEDETERKLWTLSDVAP